MSPLAYQTNFLVATVKNGLLNKFNVYRQTSGMPDITLLIENQETDQPNGTRVKIYLKDESHKINYRDVEEISYISNIINKELSFFDNVIFEFKNVYNYYKEWNLTNIQNDYNKGKIIENNLFKWRTTSQYSDEMHLVLGKVCYPIDWKTIGVKRITIPVGIKFNIGDIQVTMTRESILYSDETVRLIKDKITKVCKDLVNKYNNQNEPVEGLFNFIQQKKKTGYEVIKFDIGEELPYVLNVSELKGLNKTIFKPIQHLKLIKSYDIDNILYQFTVLNEKIEDGRQNKNRFSLLDYKNTQLSAFNKRKLILLDHEENIPDNKDFRKYIQNCLFIKTKKIAKYYYNSWLDNLGVEIKTETINKVYTSNKRNEITDELLSTLKTKKVEVKTKPIGIIKELIEFKNIILEELKKEFDVITYKDFKIPEDWLLEQKRLAKEARQPKLKLEGVIPYKDVVNSYSGELELSKLQNFKGILIYGFLKENKNLELMNNVLKMNISLRDKTKYNSLKFDFNSKAIKIFRISQSNEYLFHKLPNAIHVNLFMLSNNKIMCRLIESVKIRTKYSYIYDDINSMNALKTINFNVYLAMKEISNYQDKVDYRHNDTNTFIKELLDLDKLGVVKYKDPIIHETVKWLDDYFKDCDLLKHVTWDKSSMPYIIDFLKSKNKKLNYNHYLNSNEIQIEKDLSRTFIDSFGLLNQEEIIQNPFNYLNKVYMTDEQEKANKQAYEQQQKAEAFLINEQSTPESDDIFEDDDLVDDDYENNQEELLEQSNFNTSEGEE